MKRQEQLGVSSPGEQKDLPQGLAEGDFASSDRTWCWTCLLRGQHKHGRSTRLHSNKLHQTCRPVNQLEHVCVEECPLTTRHTTNRSGDSCEEVATTELRRECTPEAEAGGSRTTARRSEGSCGNAPEQNTRVTITSTLR